MDFSKYQKLIFKFAEHSKKSAVVEAVAGSGKTTTSVQALGHIPGYMNPIFLAFNKSIVEELEKKVPSGTDVSTMHSLGWRAMKRFYGNDISIVEKKAVHHAQVVLKDLRKNPWFWGYLYNIVKLTDIVRQNVSFDEDSILFAMEHHAIPMITGEEPTHVLKLITSMTSDLDVFDFTDMLFFPAMNEQIKLPKYDFVVVDELQDLNEAQKVMVGKLLHKDSRFLGVGDSRQAIYGFRGSDANSFNKFKAMENTALLPLSICYRCCQSVVNEAKLIVPQIECYEGQIEGKVRNGDISEISDGDWVVCRNTKPLVVLAFVLISDGKKAKIKGKEVGENLITMIKSVGVNIQSVCLRMLKSKRDDLCQKVRDTFHMERPENHPKIIKFDEDIQIIEFLFDKLGKDVRYVLKFLEETFSDDKLSITLSTIHKAKGLENDRVFFLRPDLIPSKYAVNSWQLEQESNLKYVAITRAKKELVYVRDFPFEQILKNDRGAR